MIAPDDPRHGTPRGVRVGCKERCCTTAATRYEKTRKLHTERTGTGYLVPAWRSLRRLQALQALGWSMPQIAAWSGRDYRHFYFISHQEHTSRAIFNEVQAAYEALSMTPPPTDTQGQRISVSKAKAHATRRGYLPPLAWDNIDALDERPLIGPRRTAKHDVDPVVVERVLAGDRLSMTTAERRAVVTRARGLGWSFLQIVARTGITKPERVAGEAA